MNRNQLFLTALFFVLLFSFQASLPSAAASDDCLSEATRNGGFPPKVSARFWRYYPNHNRPVPFQGVVDETGKVMHVGEAHFFQSWSFKFDGCTFGNSMSHQILAFDNGDVFLAAQYTKWEDALTTPVQGLFLGRIQNLPNWLDHETGYDKNGQFVREVEVNVALTFALDFSKHRRVVGAYGIPMGIETYCDYHLQVSSPRGGLLEIKESAYYGRPKAGEKKRCL